MVADLPVLRMAYDRTDFRNSTSIAAKAEGEAKEVLELLSPGTKSMKNYSSGS